MNASWVQFVLHLPLYARQHFCQVICKHVKIKRRWDLESFTVRQLPLMSSLVDIADRHQVLHFCKASQAEGKAAAAASCILVIFVFSTHSQNFIFCQVKATLIVYAFLNFKCEAFSLFNSSTFGPN